MFLHYITKCQTKCHITTVQRFGVGQFFKTPNVYLVCMLIKSEGNDFYIVTMSISNKCGSLVLSLSLFPLKF